MAVKQPTKGDIKMGMDSYLYKTTKEEHSNYVVQNAKYEEINKEFIAFCDSLIKSMGKS